MPIFRLNEKGEPESISDEEFEAMKADGRLTSVPLDEFFSNPIGDVVTEVFDAFSESSGLYELLADLGEATGQLLLEWNSRLPEDQRHEVGWVLKKAHDEVNARLWRSLKAKLNVAMGFDPDFEP